MEWILIAVVSGSIVTSGHPTKEACMGRVATLAEKEITAECHKAPMTTINSGIMYLPQLDNKQCYFENSGQWRCKR